jgi:hypothetical protein
VWARGNGSSVQCVANTDLFRLWALQLQLILYSVSLGKI